MAIQEMDVYTAIRSIGSQPRQPVSRRVRLLRQPAGDDWRSTPARGHAPSPRQREPPVCRSAGVGCFGLASTSSAGFRMRRGTRQGDGLSTRPDTIQQREEAGKTPSKGLGQSAWTGRISHDLGAPQGQCRPQAPKNAPGRSRMVADALGWHWTRKRPEAWILLGLPAFFGCRRAA